MMEAFFLSCKSQENTPLYEIPYSIAPQYYSRLTAPYIIVKDSNEKCAIYSLRQKRFFSDFVYDDVEIIGHGYFMTNMKGILPTGLCLTDSLGNDLTKRGEYNSFSFASNDIISGYGWEQQCYYNIKTKQFVDVNELYGDSYVSMDGFDSSNYSVFFHWKTEKVGLVDSNNRIIIQPHYSGMRNPVEGLVAAAIYKGKKKKWGVIDFKEDNIIPFNYNDVYVSSFNYIAVQDAKGKWGVINRTNQWIVKPTYDAPIIFNDGLAIVEKNNRMGVIDSLGNIRIPLGIYDITDLGARFFMIIDSNGHVIIVNSNNVEIFKDLKLTRDEMESLRQKEGFIAVNSCVDEIQITAYYDLSGKPHIKNKYKKVENFNNGYARIMNHENKWGVIDHRFNEVVPCLYDWIYRFIPPEKIIVYGKQDNNYSTLFVKWNEKELQ